MDVAVLKHLGYASGYFDLKMFDDALREADLVLALEPDQPQALAVKSAVFWHGNRFDEAEPFVAKLADLHPNDSAIWINLAYIRRRTQSLEAAAETLQRAFDANPRDALAHFNMACYRAQQHRTEEALQLLRNALRLNPKLKKLARVEPDFSTLRESPEFLKLINGK
jgi:tetratricopeptide (TPR) repeat protein